MEEVYGAIEEKFAEASSMLKVESDKVKALEVRLAESDTFLQEENLNGYR